MKKQIKKVTKKTSTPKRELYVDLYNVDDLDDLYFNMALGKTNAGINITVDELYAIYKKGVKDTFTVGTVLTKFADAVNEAVTALFPREEKKTPWYKKLWNKITKVFKRK